MQDLSLLQLYLQLLEIYEFSCRVLRLLRVVTLDLSDTAPVRLMFTTYSLGCIVAHMEKKQVRYVYLLLPLYLIQMALNTRKQVMCWAVNGYPNTR